ncbi:hypothetical protein PHSY_000602 [Pseudozyma hubeiensis SY62]|uniref:Uncharacterized protein n=1 Tax=Pseudozyma hubeiensis (strain SY62) TaxID=1305764 RepID=R9NWX6_PSEHS|nr:hypothetical protein PHSY_000602 [Pseudozyma hubeiensis SY62]GAC93041.1 hypothetical protein PHSY_000602 [Pseudozyma hubeiensis SY62]
MATLGDTPHGGRLALMHTKIFEKGPVFSPYSSASSLMEHENDVVGFCDHQKMCGTNVKVRQLSGRRLQTNLVYRSGRGHIDEPHVDHRVQKDGECGASTICRTSQESNHVRTFDRCGSINANKERPRHKAVQHTALDRTWPMHFGSSLGRGNKEINRN